MSPRRRFVFDFGKVVFDWHPPAVVRAQLPHVVGDDADAEAWAARVFQAYGGDWGEFDRGTLDVDTLVPRIAARTGLAPDDARRVVEAVPHALQPDAGTVALMQRLRDAGHTLHYLSNMPASYALHLERTHAFMAWFESGVFSSRVGHIKPERAIFEHAARMFGGDAAGLVFFDDHPPNVEAARALGWQALHFTTAAAARADCERHGWLA
jgi:putative hydrolase of the HAD superfamily